MIISASRRTDIPAFYSDWLLRRLEERFVCVRNPFNRHQVSRVKLNADCVECIVFWTKDPAPFMRRQTELDAFGIPYYFQFTLNAYGSDIEPGVPSLDERIKTFQALSRRVGESRVIWRYDPILFTEKHTENFHIETFAALARQLAPFTRRCVISFLDLYQKTIRNMKPLALVDPPDEAKYRLAEQFSKIARANQLELVSCSEELELGNVGIRHGSCIDPVLISELTGVSCNCAKDHTQRLICGCVESVDIGAYDSCPHGCRYCYANADHAAALDNNAIHDPNSPLMLGKLLPDDRIFERKIKTHPPIQPNLL